MRFIARFAAIAGVCALPFACADFSSPEDPTFGLPDVEVAQPSYVSDVQPILTRRCTVGGCHTLASEQGGLALDPSVAYDELVGVTAISSVDGYLRVEAGNAADSWVIRRLHANPALRNGLPRMPLGATPLTDNQIATIVNWIDQGAPRN